MIKLKLILASVIACTALPVLAGPDADALGRCLAENTKGKERKDLARWMFVAMTAHPDMRPLSAATERDREQTSRAMGALLTKLLSEGCPAQAKAAIQNEGSQAMQAAFGTLGQLAMQELMTNQDVNKSVNDFERFIDREKVEDAMRPK